jgi:ESCRT-II complex subunit VPS22
MKKKVGVSIVKKKQSEKEQYNKIGKTLEDNKLSFVQDILISFKSSLSEFASKHKNRINSDPEFRQQFHMMCISVGVDPLASNKGYWSDILGVGDFYFELGVKIINVCVQTRSINGGIISLNELYCIIKKKLLSTTTASSSSSPKTTTSLSSSSLLSKNSNNNELSIYDIKRAIEKLMILGNGFKLVENNGNCLLISVPLEVNIDHEYVLSAGSDNDSYVTGYNVILINCYMFMLL